MPPIDLKSNEFLTGKPYSIKLFCYTEVAGGGTPQFNPLYVDPFYIELKRANNDETNSGTIFTIIGKGTNEKVLVGDPIEMYTALNNTTLFLDRGKINSPPALVNLTNVFETNINFRDLNFTQFVPLTSGNSTTSYVNMYDDNNHKVLVDGANNMIWGTDSTIIRNVTNTKLYVFKV